MPLPLYWWLFLAYAEDDHLLEPPLVLVRAPNVAAAELAALKLFPPTTTVLPVTGAPTQHPEWATNQREYEAAVFFNRIIDNSYAPESSPVYWLWGNPSGEGSVWDSVLPKNHDAVTLSGFYFRYYLACYKKQCGKYHEALAVAKKLHNDLPADHPLKIPVEDLIHEIESLMGSGAAGANHRLPFRPKGF